MEYFGLTFEYPYLLLVLPALLIIRLLNYQRKTVTALPTPKLSYGESGNRSISFSTIRRFTLEFIHLLLIISLCLGAMRPVEIQSVLPGSSERRNLILALDVSRSMEAEDFRSSEGVLKRLEGVKYVTEKFIARRLGDRMGLVIFGSSAFLQSPLTIDHQFLINLIKQLRVGIAGDGTAIGDGLGLALKRVQELESDTRAVILMTDGVSNSGVTEPIKTAKIAKDLGIRVYTIGIGSQDGTYMNVGRGILGSRIYAEFDEETLKKIAAMTGAKYYFAGDTNKLETIYREIDSLERSEEEDQTIQQRTEWYPYFALIALILFCIHFTLSQTILRVYP